MKEGDLKRGVQIALAVAAALSVGACGGDDDDDDPVGAASKALVCIGGNACQGMSECAGGPSSNACEGMNECKGMGWSYTKTEKECADAGGEVAT